MMKLFRLGLSIYTAIVGLLIPVVLLIKASSFNNDYYPTSFILFIVLLTTIFVSTCGILIMKFSKAQLRKFLKILSFISILIGVVLQIIGLFDLSKEKISSGADVTIALLYIILLVLGVFSLFALGKIQK